MCYHKQQKEMLDDVANYYSASYAQDLSDIYKPMFYENGFDFNPGLVITAERPQELQLFSWGLIPWWTKNAQEAKTRKLQTLNCISEEMFDKPSFKDSIKEGKRCLIPCTGFFEWRHLNNGKQKYPYYIFLKERSLFSIAGIYSNWVDKSTGEEIFTYSVLTTQANPLMERIHNSKKRMPVIFPKEYEKDWLNPNLTKDDVLSLCTPLSGPVMDAYTISKKITDRSISDKNVLDLSNRFEYPELSLFDA